jgi:hypothetical protein
MATHVLEVGQSLALLLILTVVCVGWGTASQAVLGVPRQAVQSRTGTIWIGWTVLLFFLQVLHLLFALTAWVVIALFAIGVLLALPSIPSAVRTTRRRHFVLAMLMLLAAIYIISRAMLPPQLFDSGLYHFNTIRWINSFPIVPGLGNLQGRLAFNQSYFTFIAAMDFYPYWVEGAGLSNSFLLLLSILTAIEACGPLLVAPRSLAELPPIQTVPGLFALGPLIYLAEFSDGLSSPGVDLAATLLAIVIFLMLARLIAAWAQGDRKQGQQLLALSLLAATAVTVKLSLLAFAGCAGIFCVVYCWQAFGPMRLPRLLWPPVTIMAVWALQGIVLSGAPLYPSTFGHLSVDWAVPVKQANYDATWIYGWTREPFVPPEQVLSGWNWLKPWELKISGHRIDVLYPLNISGIFFIIALALSLPSWFKRSAGHAWLEWSVLTPMLASIVFWFVMAPDPRFSDGAFWLLAIGTAAVLLCQIRRWTEDRLIFAVVFVILFAAVNDLFADKTIHDFKEWSLVSLQGWQPIPKAAIIEKRTDSGLMVYTPASDECTWDAPLPATPYFNPRLRLRVPGNLGSGFTVQP